MLLAGGRILFRRGLESVSALCAAVVVCLQEQSRLLGGKGLEGGPDETVKLLFLNIISRKQRFKKKIRRPLQPLKHCQRKYKKMSPLRLLHVKTLSSCSSISQYFSNSNPLP